MFKFYNPHPQGKMVEDCVKRALTKATGKEYQEVAKELNAIKREQGASAYNVNSVWKAYLEDHLKAEKMSFPAVKGQPRMNGERFCESHPHGTYVLNMAGHLSCCVDGVIYDTWDCTEKCVYTAYALVAGSANAVVEEEEGEEEFAMVCDALSDPDNLARKPTPVVHLSGTRIIEDMANAVAAKILFTKKKHEPWIELNKNTVGTVIFMLMHHKEYQHLRWRNRVGSSKTTLFDEKTGTTLILKNAGDESYLWCTKE